MVTLKSKFKTIFDFSIFKLYHMQNLIAVVVKMSELRGKAQCVSTPSCEVHEKAP